MTFKKVPKTRFLDTYMKMREISIFTAQVKMTLKISKMTNRNIKNDPKLQVLQDL